METPDMIYMLRCTEERAMPDTVKPYLCISAAGQRAARLRADNCATQKNCTWPCGIISGYVASSVASSVAGLSKE